MRTLTPAVALLAATAILLAACGGSDRAAPATSTSTSTTTSTTAAVDPADIEVRVVADSEVPDGVSELLDQEEGIRVASMRSAQGATMAELDESVDEALAQQPDVLVYSGGTNDLGSGPLVMLDGLKGRLARYAGQTCVVMAVPVFRYERGTDAEVQARTNGTRILEQAAADSGAHVASYLDVSLAMDRAGEDFFAEGELGDLHPAPSSYPAIAASIADQVRACGSGG